MSTDTERRELIRPDATIAYWVSGPERAPVVLLLHGATLDHRAWDAQVDELTPQYRVVVPDLRGHGESTLEGAFRFDDAVDDVAALLDAVDTGAPVAARGPEPGRQHRPGDRAPRPPAGGCAGRRGLHLQHRIAPPAGRAADDRRAVGDGAGRPRAVHAARGGGHLAARRRAPVRPGRQRGPHDPRGPADPHLAAGPGACARSRTTACRSRPCWCTAPTTGSATSSRAARSGRPATRMVELVVIPDAGHASNQDNPAAFTAALTAFLDRALPVPARGQHAGPVERAARATDRPAARRA